MFNKKFTFIPYYKPKGKISDQIKHSSSKRRMGKFKFTLIKIRNHFLSSLAYNCPINIWRVQFHRWRGVQIGKGVMIGLRCTLDHAFPEYICLEDNTALAGDVYITTHSNPYEHHKGFLLSYVAPVIIREGAWIGINVTILPNVEIGKNSIVSAGSVVSQNIPERVIVRGNPAQVIKKFKQE